MRHPAYPHLILPHSFISEGSPLEEPEFSPEHLVWTDDEIAAIRAVLKKLTAIRVFNSNDAEDIVQETLLTMVSKHPGTVLEKGPLVWGLGILRKKVGNYYRKAQRYAPLRSQDADAQSCMQVVSPEAKLFQSELQTIVEAVLSQFPLSQRKALELMMAGFNAGEIAKFLHPERYQNVINNLYRGRKKLARELAKYGYVPNAATGMAKLKLSRGRKQRSGA